MLLDLRYREQNQWGTDGDFSQWPCVGETLRIHYSSDCNCSNEKFIDMTRVLKVHCWTVKSYEPTRKGSFHKWDWAVRTTATTEIHKYTNKSFTCAFTRGFWEYHEHGTMLTLVIKLQSIHRYKWGSSQLKYSANTEITDWTEQFNTADVVSLLSWVLKRRCIRARFLVMEASVPSSSQYISARRNLITQRNVWHLMQ